MQPALFNYLAEAGQQAPSADNSQPWHFSIEDKIMHLWMDLDKVQPSCFSPVHPAVLISMGAVIENILQAADWVNIRVQYQPELDTATGHCAAFTVADLFQTLPEHASDAPLFKRATNRLPFTDSRLPESLISLITDLDPDNQHIRLFDTPKEILKWAEWVRMASEIRFQTPDIHEWFGQSLKFTPAERASHEGLDVRSLGLPGPGLAMLKATRTWRRMKCLNHFGMYRLIAGLEAGNVTKAPALIGFFAPLSADQALAIGRLIERTWILLCEHNISVQPYFVITDQLFRSRQGMVPAELMTASDRLAEQLNTEYPENFVYMLFRIGYCDRQTIRSPRRPATFK